MTLLFLNLGVAEMFVIILIALVFCIAIGRYGKDTALSYSGSIVLCLLTTPLVAFIVITILKSRKTAYSPD